MTAVDVVTPVDTSVPTGLGAPVARLEGLDKVTGAARYAYEHTPDGVLYGWIVQSAVTTGTITGSNRDAVLAMPGKAPAPPSTDDHASRKRRFEEATVRR